jgi:adenosylmethionine-8-amino-7-oxononanoate aminotransferase
MSSLLERDARSLWHPYTQHQLEPSPLPIVAAHGATLVLEDGREILDAISSWWACLHGHAHPVLIDAMSEQARALDHVLFAGCTHEPAVELAERLISLAPRGLERVFFSDNGSTAVEVALKMVVQSWVHAGQSERRVFISLEGGYHGDTFGAMAVGDPDPFFRPFAPLLFAARRVAPQAEALESALAELGARAAGVLIEPLVQGGGGMRMHGADFVRAAREACSRHGVPLIADEVLTGFGRTGALFACERAGVAPDVLCLAKALTGGLLPLAATLSSERLYSAFLSTDRSKAFFHGHTFTANPIACAVARASLELCLQDGVPARLELIGQRIEGSLAELLGSQVSSRLGLRRTGGIVALDLPAPAGDSRGYLSARALSLRARALELGVLLRPLGDVLYCMPPACVTEAQCGTIARAMHTLALESATADACASRPGC